MTSVRGATGTQTVTFTPPARASGATISPSLLPTPSADRVDVGDAITRLLQMSSQISEQQMLLGKGQIDAASNQHRCAAARRKEALDQAIEAARKAREARREGGIFSCITDNIGLTGLVGLATFNVGLVAADVTAHRAGLTGGSTSLLDASAALRGGPFMHLASQGAKSLAPEGMGPSWMPAMLLGGPVGLAIEQAAEKLVPDDLTKSVDELTSIKDDDVRLANKIALTIALAAAAATSTVLTGGTSAPALVALVGIAISTATQVTAQTGALEEVFGEKAAMYVALGGAITGSALTLGGSLWSTFSVGSAAKDVAKLNTELKSSVKAIEAARTITEGVATTAEGVRALEAAEYRRDADLANIDAEQQRHLLQRLERLIDDVLADLNEAKESAQRATETLQATIQTHHQTALRAGSMKV